MQVSFRFYCSKKNHKLRTKTVVGVIETFNMLVYNIADLKMKTRGKSMSQAKVDNYKKEKAGRKQALKRKKLLRALYAVIAVAVVVGFGFLIYFSTRPQYDVNMEDSKFDEVALASALGYDGVNITDYIEPKEDVAEETPEGEQVVEATATAE